MLTAQDFNKKQILFVFANDGEKISFSNDNLLVKSKDGKTKIQCTCYRLFLVFVVGHCSITTVMIQKARKFGVFFALMTPSFRLYTIIGAEKEGNFLLHRKQYEYDQLGIAKHIVRNKVECQQHTLKSVRNKSEAVKEAILLLEEYKDQILNCQTRQELMAFEGLASKVYFRNHFNNVPWSGRCPRLKSDYINSALDIGYTLLFSFVDAIVSCFGFDTYCGVLHTQFYMRKSLVCDLVEPFRCLVDHSIKKAVNLKQLQEDDFLCVKNQYQLKWEKNAEYIKFMVKPLIENKEAIFQYIQAYYRAFMKGLPVDSYPVFVRVAEDNR